MVFNNSIKVVSPMFTEILNFLGMVGAGFIFALGFRGCDAFLKLAAGYINRSRRKKGR